MEKQGQRVTAIARCLCSDNKLPTPFLFLDRQVIDDSLSYFHKYLPDVRLFYAVKANPSSSLLSYFQHKGLCFDVSSGEELARLEKLGVSSDDLILSTPIKTPSTIQALFASRVKFAVVDTLAELERINHYRLSNRHSHVPGIFVRFKVESQHVEVDLNRKFGCTINEAIQILRSATDLGFPVAGVSFHVGTQAYSVDNYFLGIQNAIVIAKEVHRRFGINVPMINIGGGFCDRRTAQSKGISLDEFFQTLGVACRQAIDAGFSLIAEPGRFLVNDAGTIVSSVIGMNHRAHERWVYLDDGIYGCYSIKIYEKTNFEFIAFRGERTGSKIAHDKPFIKSIVAGPTCDSLDVIADSVELPEDLSIGDFVVSPNLGAYTLSTATNFNGFYIPACHVVDFLVQRGKAGARIWGISDVRDVRKQRSQGKLAVANSPKQKSRKIDGRRSRRAK